MKCIIIDDNMSSLWKEIVESLSRQHIGEESNRKKRINKQLSLALTNTTSQIAQIATILDEQETIATISSAPSRST